MYEYIYDYEQSTHVVATADWCSDSESYRNGGQSYNNIRETQAGVARVNGRRRYRGPEARWHGRFLSRFSHCLHYIYDIVNVIPPLG